VEPFAWEVVNAQYVNDPPSKIFLVIEQTLTSGYAITHKQATTAECELQLSARVPLPKEGEASVFMGYRTERAHASYGFEESQGEESNKEYAIFLTIHESFPIRRLKFAQRSLRSRVKDMYRYTSFLRKFTYSHARSFIKMNKKYNQANQSTASVPKPVAKDSGGVGSSGQAKQDTVAMLSVLRN
jgi:hypothetical protein